MKNKVILFCIVSLCVLTSCASNTYSKSSLREGVKHSIEKREYKSDRNIILPIIDTDTLNKCRVFPERKFLN